MILFFLALSDRDPSLKETMKGVLSFYRENRELLTALFEPEKNAKSEENRKDDPQKDDAFKESDGKIELLEAFLKNRTR